MSHAPPFRRDAGRAPAPRAPRRRAPLDPRRGRGVARRGRLRALLDAPARDPLRVHRADDLPLLRRQAAAHRRGARGRLPAHPRAAAAGRARPGAPPTPPPAPPPPASERAAREQLESPLAALLRAGRLRASSVDEAVQCLWVVLHGVISLRTNSPDARWM